MANNKDSVTTETIRAGKGKRKIVSLTAYDFQLATILDQNGVDVVLVGDSLGNVVFGREHTLSVTVEEVLHHTRAVAPACKRALVVADMPFMSYQSSNDLAVDNAGLLLAKGGAQAVKLEGGQEMAERAQAIFKCGIPVMGHIGLTPQSIHRFGRFRMTGRDQIEKEALLADARALEEAGAFAIVLECVEEALAGKITESIAIPTIGIGSGQSVDGQILVLNDLIGLNVGHVPRFAQPEGNVKEIIAAAVRRYGARTREES